MSEKSAPSSFEKVAARLKKAKNLLALTHARPDGDGLGCVFALVRAARAAGKQAAMLVPDSVPARYDFLFAAERPAGPERFPALADHADAIVILDTSASSQLDGLVDALRAMRSKLVVIDHHATADNLADAVWADESAAATGVMLTELLDSLGWPMDLPTAEAVMMAITYDTGWLQFANTDSRCLRAAGRWLDAGVRPDKLYRKLFQTDRPERLHLLGRLLDSLELHCDGKLAIMSLRLGDFAATGALQSETDNMVNEALRMGTVDTAVLLVETPECVRVSLRSRDALDVAAIASQFGGGGHRRAAGLRSSESFDGLKAKLLTACAAGLT